MSAAIRSLVLAWLALAWFAGVALAALSGPAALIVAPALGIALAAIGVVRGERILWVYAALLPVVLALAVVRHETARPGVGPGEIARYNDGPSMRFRGVVRDDADVGETTQRFAVDVRQVQVRGEWVQADGRVLVATGLIPLRRAGDVLELEGDLGRPPRIEEFDFAAYLARRGIRSVASFPATRVIGHEGQGPLRSTLIAVRRRLAHAIETSLPEPEASLAEGVLLGKRAALPDDVSADLNATNTSHLVVVSGSNIVLVASLTTAALSWILGRRRALASSLGVVVAYALLVGLSPPVVRATIMGTIVIMAMLSGRRSDALIPVLIAGALITLAQPGVVEDVSFQLTFAATVGIAWLATPIRSAFLRAFGHLFHTGAAPAPVGLLADQLAITLSATIAVTPLIAFDFGRISTVGLLANLLITPAFTPILAASAFVAVGSLVQLPQVVAAAPAHYLLAYWLFVARHLAALPGAAPAVSVTAWWTWAAYALLIATTLLVGARARGAAASPVVKPLRFRPRSVLRAGTIAVPAVALVASAGFILRSPPPPRLTMTVLDVGEGDAILLRTPAGDDVLVDGGPGRSVLRGLGSELSWRDRSIEYVVSTHPQADHLTGLLDVLDRYDVKRLLAGPGQGGANETAAWRRAAADEGVRLETLRAGARFELRGGVRIDVLGPDDAMAADPNLNNAGAVLRVEWGDIRFLLAADIEAGAETELLRDGQDLRADVLKVAHHGSKTSTARAFLDAVDPSVAVISAGRDNRYGHPAPEVVTRLGEYAPVYNTADDGAVRVETDGRDIWVDGERVASCRAC